MPPVLVLMDRDFSGETLRQNDSLDLRCIDPKAWETLISSCTASEIKLYYLKIPSLAGIDRLRNTSSLSLEWANKIEDLSPLFSMHWLTKLFLSDLPRIRKIDGIESLEDLKVLRLSGNRSGLNPPLRLESVLPISGLRKLESLELTNLRLEQNDISFVADSFPNLRHLRLSGKAFERAQLAYLASRLNAQLEEPLVSSWDMGPRCHRCGRNLHLFLGRRMPMLCEFCDEKRFKKLTEEFQNPT